MRAAYGSRVTVDAAGRARFGALPQRDGVRFRVLAQLGRAAARLLTGAAAGTIARPATGRDLAFVRGAGRRSLRLHDSTAADPRPDPASRFQPDGVHGPSASRRPDRVPLAAPTGGPSRRESSSSTSSTSAPSRRKAPSHAARQRLAELRDLGVTAIELMPVADFAGARNWGYDGVCLFAPVAQLWPAGRPARACRRRPRARARASCSTSSTTISARRART